MRDPQICHPEQCSEGSALPYDVDQREGRSRFFTSLTNDMFVVFVFGVQNALRSDNAPRVG